MPRKTLPITRATGVNLVALVMDEFQKYNNEKGGDSVAKKMDWKITFMHCYNDVGPKKNDKVYVAVIEQLSPNEFRVCGFWGPTKKVRLAMDEKGTHSTLEAAEREFDLLVAEKTSYRKGYVDIEDPAYKRTVASEHRVTTTMLMQKFDARRVVGVGAVPDAAPALISTKKPAGPQQIDDDDRADRSLI